MKEILFEREAQAKVHKGVNIIADCVAATMGPGGQVVAYQSHSGPVLSKDGVSVAKEVDLEDPFERLGADLIKEAAKKTNDIAGDGTTTATVLARAIFNEGYKRISAGENPIEVKKEIEKSTQEVVKNLTALAVPVDSPEKLEQVASISSNDKELGKIIAGLMNEVGPDGLITLEDSPSFGIETELTKGTKLEGGFISPYMVTDPEKMLAEMKDCPVYVCDKKLTLAQEILPLMEDMSSKGMKELLIVCDTIDGPALATLIVNQRGFKAVAMRCPGIGDHRRREQMKDICALTGATFVSDESGHDPKEVKSSVLGKARKVLVTQTHTTIIEGAGDQSQIDIRIGGIKAELESTKSDYDQQKLKERLANLTGSVGVIKIGGTNEPEIKERRQRIEDAVNATRAAQEEGIVVGGGTALIRASHLYCGILSKSCEAPLRTIAQNVGKNGEVVLEKVLALTGNEGYNASTDTYEDLMLSGVIDPLKVTRTALENASSIACLLLTTKAVMVKKEEKK